MNDPYTRHRRSLIARGIETDNLPARPAPLDALGFDDFGGHDIAPEASGAPEHSGIQVGDPGWPILEAVFGVPARKPRYTEEDVRRMVRLLGPRSARHTNGVPASDADTEPVSSGSPLDFSTKHSYARTRTAQLDRFAPYTNPQDVLRCYERLNKRVYVKQSDQSGVFAYPIREGVHRLRRQLELPSLLFHFIILGGAADGGDVFVPMDTFERLYRIHSENSTREDHEYKQAALRAEEREAAIRVRLKGAGDDFPHSHAYQMTDSINRRRKDLGLYPMPTTHCSHFWRVWLSGNAAATMTTNELVTRYDKV